MKTLLKSSVLIPLALCAANTGFAQESDTGLFTSTIGTADLALADVDSATLPSTVDFNILSCPFDIFREAYLGVFEAPDRLAIMALEEEAISACAKRQTQVNLVLKQEQELRELLEQSVVANAASATVRANAAETTVIELALDDQAALGQASTGSDEVVANQTALIAQMKRAVKEAQNSCTFEYGVESAGHQLGGDGNFGWATLRSTDGTSFVVKKDDLLPGDLRVASVSKSAVFVEAPDGSRRELPVAPYEHAEVIDLNFKYTLTPVDKLQEQEANQ